MRQRLLSTLCAIVVLWGSAEAVELHDRFRTFTRELLKSEYLNDWQDDTAAKINELVAFHPADSTKSGTATHDTLAANGDAQITTMDPLVSLSASDSLKFHRANINRAHFDTIFVGPVPATAPSWAIGVTAGHQSHFSYADTDTLNADSLTVSGPAVFDGAVNLNSTFSIGTTAVTATATELNILDGVTATTAELNILDGVTSNATELNLLDGVTALGTLSAITYDQTIAKLDTTIGSVGTSGGGGYKVIVGSLLNWDDNCVGGNRWQGRWDCSGSYEAWREKEKSTSWYQASRGDTTAQFPTNYAIKIQVGQDSTTVLNRDTGELWMAFAMASSGQHMIGNTGDTVNDMAMKDGTLYLATGGGNASWGFAHRINFLSDISEANYISGLRRWPFNIQNRNASGGTEVNMSSVAIVNNTVNAVAVVRDPFGLSDENGAPKHWWVTVDGAGTASAYNPHTNAIYDASDAGNSGTFGVLSSRGRFLRHSEDGTTDDFRPRNTIFNITADGWDVSGGVFQYDQSGANDFGWTVGVTMSDGATIEGQSIVGYNDDIAIIGSDQGVYNFHFAPNTAGAVTASNSVGARQRLSSTVNAPIEFGDAVLVAAFEDNTTDSSPYGNTLTATNGGTVSAVFGNGYSGCVGCYLTREDDTDLAIIGADMTVSLWTKTSFVGAAILVAIEELAAGDNGYFTIGLDASGNPYFQIQDSASATSQVFPSIVIADGKWHHIAVTFQNDINTSIIYLDGVNVGSATTAIATSADDDLRIGESPATTPYYNGLIDELAISKSVVSADAIAKLHAEGRKQLNRGGSPINRDHLHAADVDYVDALDNGIWLAGNEDSLTVFDGRLALQTFGASGTINDAKLIQNAGTDSIGVIIVTNTETILIQPDVSLEKMASSQLYHKEPILIGETVVVDSAGVGGIFWTANDAIGAAFNARKTDVFVLDGTYGHVNLLSGSGDGIHLHCSGARSAVGGDDGGVEFQGNSGGSGAITFTANGRVSNCGFYTAPSGGGGGASAVAMSTGSYGSFDHNVIRNADNIGIYIAMGHARVTNNLILAADDQAIYGETTSDGSVIMGNNSQTNNGTNFIEVAAGGNYVTVVGNVGDKPVVNNGTGGVSSANIEF